MKDVVQKINSRIGYSTLIIKIGVHKGMLNQFMRLADKVHKEKTGKNLIGWGTM